MKSISLGMVSMAVLSYSQMVSVVQAEEVPAKDALVQEVAREETIVLEKITISVRKRDETVQETPASVTVKEANDLGNGRINTLEDFAKASPNTIFNPQSGPVTIRGIGSVGVDGGLDRQLGVGIFVDEVYVGRVAGIPKYLDDLERIEVVRGSQSTLYGKNSIAGAINLVAKEPGDELAVSAGVSFGDLSYRRFTAAIDAPLADGDILTRSFLTYTKRDGYIANSTNNFDEADVDSIGGRFSAIGYLGNATAVKLTLDYEKNEDDGGIPYVPVAQALQYKSNLDFEPYAESWRGGATLKVEHDTGSADFTSISAFRAYHQDVALDGDFSSSPFLGQAEFSDQWQMSQELRLASSEAEGAPEQGELRWMIGGFFMHEDYEGAQQYDYAALSRSLWSSNYLEQTTDTYSVFGELGYYMTAQLELTGGLRYTYETKEGEASVTSPSGNFFFGAASVVSASPSFQNVSPEVSFAYQATPDVMTYGKVGMGFKAGGVSQFVDTGNTANEYDPETSINYELGAKTAWFDDTVNFNVAVFYVDWRDQQARVNIDPLLPTLRAIRNAASSHSYGLEIEGSALLSQSLSATAAYGYQEAEYDDFKDAIAGVDYSGNDLPNAPKHSFSAGLKWNEDLSDNLQAFASSNYSFRSSYALDSEGAYRQAPTHIVDATVGLEWESWEASVWVKNLTDERYLKGYFRNSGMDFGIAAEKRTIGVSLKSHW
ncbi:MAG: TonB-dependent receptor [Parvibaculaceae bacterium]|nr:TonB-dependent receptor [Parvibaculaceae bacterium]